MAPPLEGIAVSTPHVRDDFTEEAFPVGPHHVDQSMGKVGFDVEVGVAKGEEDIPEDIPEDI